MIKADPWLAESPMQRINCKTEAGFSLVELMVVVSIVGILAAVGTPYYINYINRVKQSEAASQLLTARIDMEEFYTDNNRYAQAIGCLPSFGADCAVTSRRLRYYTFTLESVNNATAYYRIGATRNIYSWAAADRVFISSSTQVPQVANTDALKFSVYQWLFQ